MTLPGLPIHVVICQLTKPDEGSGVTCPRGDLELPFHHGGILHIGNIWWDAEDVSL